MGNITQTELNNLIKNAKQEVAIKTETTDVSIASDGVSEIVQDELSKAINKKKQDERFETIVDELAERELANETRKKLLDALSEKQKNDLKEYVLKQEKKIQRQIAEAEIIDKKYKSAMRRYGYLYPKKDKNGNFEFDENGRMVVDLEQFTPNVWANRFKEFEVNYAKMNKTSRRIISVTLKTVITIGSIALFIFLLVKGWGLIAPILLKFAALS